MFVNIIILTFASYFHIRQMKKIIITIAFILLILCLCYVGWRWWNNSQNQEEPEDALEMPGVALYTIPTTTEEPVANQYTPWRSLSWYGQQLSDEQSSLSFDVLSKQLNPNTIGKICQPEYALYFRHVTDENYNARPASILLKINSLLCSTGRKNDDILSLYAYLRQFKKHIPSPASNYVRLLYRSYSFYCNSNEAPDDQLLQQAYTALRTGKVRSVSVKLKPVLGDSFIKVLTAEGYKLDEIEWACSFWPRRAAEKNIYALYEIVKDLHLKETGGTPGFSPGSLTNESVSANKGIRKYQSYHLADGSPKCTYFYDRNGKKTGNWVFKPYNNSSKIIECRMENDMLEGAYIIWLPNQSVRYTFSKGYLESKAIYWHQRLISEDFYRQELKDQYISYY